jgi:sulfite reductase (NADPH) flavoprotein alpha-component
VAALASDVTAAGVRTVCSYCGVGCGMVLDVATDAAGARRVVRAAGDKAHPANSGRLCTKGATTADMLAAPGRLDAAWLRPGGGQLRPADVDTAITVTARRLRAVLDEHGPDAVAFYVSGQMTLEAQYLTNKLAKGFVRTSHIESNSRLCMASASSGYKLSLGADGPPGSYADFDHADVFLVIGANMADCHPVLFLRLMDRVRAGARLIVVDPRRTATADKADLFLQIRPGTDLALLNGLLHLLAASAHIDTQFIAEFTHGWDVMPGFLAGYPPGRVAEITGIPEDDIRVAAQWIGQARDWMSCWTMGLNQSTHGTWNTNALCNLHLATGAICRTGSGPFSLTGQPNAMGGREMGYLGPGLPGQRSVTVDEDRRLIEGLWNLAPGTLRTGAGPGTVDMFSRMAAGEIRACWIICTNPVASVANRTTVIAGLRAADLVITQDVFASTETNAYADVILPAAMWAESDGVMVNSERTLTLLQPATGPPGQALPDWQLIARVACEMGYADGFSYASAEEIFDEITRAWNPQTGYDLRGISYQRLRQGPVQWPSPPGSTQPRSEIRYLNDGISQQLTVRPDGSTPRLAFPTASGRAVFFPRPHLPAAEMPDDRFPFVLNTGRLPHQWHTLTKTARVARLNKLNPGPLVEIHPDDAAQLTLSDGDLVEVASRRGRAVLPAVVTDRVRPGTCFAPFHWNDLFGDSLAINAVTNDAADPVSFQPEFKACAVALARVATAPRPYRAEPPGTAPGDRAPEGRADRGRELIIVWASQTGTAEDFAAHAARRLSGPAAAVRLHRMCDYPVRAMPRQADVLVITSTFGDGGAPDNGAGFLDALTAADPPCLDGVSYAVLAFGDSSYADFCGHGRRVDEQLANLGAARLLPRVDCEPDDGQRAARWLDQVARLVSRQPESAGAPRVQAAAGPAPSRPEPSRPEPSRPVPSRPGPPRRTARLAGNRLLSLPGSMKEVREFTIDLTGTGIAYEAGDVLTVAPENCPDLVAEWLASTGVRAGEPVQLESAGEVPFADALRRHLEIAAPGAALLRFVAERSQDRELPRLLRSPGRVELDRWLWGRQAIDVVSEFGVRARAQEWADVLTALRPRRYSVSSSPLVAAQEVRVMVSVVRFDSPRGMRRKGVCSAYLAEAAADAPVEVSIRRSAHFRPPGNAAAPMIMIGPGTGLAPFLGFLDDRHARGHAGANWLFFGEQHRASDFYYRDKLTALHGSGFLSRLDAAFSRDQRARVYVQDRMREQGSRLWSWLQDGAHLYVCGDATRMAKDVDQALREIIARHGGMSASAAAAYLRQLTAGHRYARDVY